MVGLRHMLPSLYSYATSMTVMSSLMSEFQEMPAILGHVPDWAGESIYTFYVKPDRFLFLCCLHRLFEHHDDRKG